MSMWSTLGIEKTHDPEAIEAAFEHQLQFIDADTSPERYQTLVQAYEAAMREAGAVPQDQEFGVEAGKEPVPMPEPATEDAEIEAGRVMTELETVFSNPGWRDDLRRWRAQLEGERAHKPGVTEVLRFRVFDFLSRQGASDEAPVSEEVLAYLDERLGWRQHRRQLENTFPLERVRSLLGGDGHEADSPLDMDNPFSDAGESVGNLAPGGFGFALIGWIIAMIILTMLFSGMR